MSIRDYIGLGDFADGKTDELKETAAEHLFDWVCGNKKISDSRELKRLNSVISNDASRSMLEKGYTLEEASEYSGEALSDFRNFMQLATAKLQEADRLSSKVRNFDESDKDYAYELARTAKKIFLYVKNELDKDDVLGL